MIYKTDHFQDKMKVLKSEKKEMESMVEGMKEKLFLAYRQKGIEGAELESKLEVARTEGREVGVKEGLERGTAEGKKQVSQLDQEED